MKKREIIYDMGYDDSIVFDNPNFDEAIIGITEEGNVVYDYEAMVESLMKQDDMDRLEAVEFIDYNTIRAIPYSPDPKPIIMHHLYE